MRLSIIYFFLFIIFVAAFYSCTPNPNGGIPFYMRIDSAALVTNYATQGYNTQNITDVWVQAGTENLGAYQMPCNFPVLQQNNVFFIINAGIEVGGLAGYREEYPFYQIDTFTVNATPGKKYSYNPVFRYSSAAIFTFTPMDFEFSVPFNSMTASDSAIYGHRCGQITVTATGDSNVVATQINSYAIPTGREVWLELDYRSEVPFNIGFIANYNNGTDSQAFSEMYVFAQPKWTKLYVPFTDDLSAAAASSYQVYFEGLRPFGSTGGNIFIDNVKLIHF